MLIQRIRAHFRRRRTKKQMKKITKTYREAGRRMAESLGNATAAMNALAEGLNSARKEKHGETSDT